MVTRLILPLLFVFLFGKDDHQLAEDVDEVKEEINRVPDVIVVTSTSFLHNQLGVVQNKGTEDKKSKVEIDIIDQRGSEEDVCQ